MSADPKASEWPGAVGVIGLGIMGSAIARNLVKAGRRVVGYDSDEAACNRAEANGVNIAADAAHLASQVELMLTSLPSEQALNDTVTNLIEGPHADGLVLAELSTLGLECKLANAHTLAAHGVTLLDCPISGTGSQAVSGDIVIYGSGDEQAFKQCVPVLADFSRASHYLGELGNGTKVKLVANLLVAINNVATAEALVLGERCGLDPNTLREVIESGAATSRVFELRAPLMISGSYEPPTMKLDVWQKDLRLIADFATNCGVVTPLFSASASLYEAAVANGRGHQDTAAVFTVLEDLAGENKPETTGE